MKLKNTHLERIFLFVSIGWMSLFLCADVSANGLPNLKFKSDRWYLQNQGKPQEVLLDHNTAYQISGRRGEDLEILNAPPRPRATSHRKIKIAVLDTGVDRSHPDLRIHKNQTQCAKLDLFESCLESKSREDCENLHFGEPDPGDPYPLNCAGWSVVSDGPDPYRVNSMGIAGQPDVRDRLGHGTHVHDLAASCSDQVEVIPVRVLLAAPEGPVLPLSLPTQLSEQGLSPKENSDGPSLLRQAGRPRHVGDAIARGLIYALHEKADVINISLSWPKETSTELIEQVIQKAIERGVLIVASAGNDSSEEMLYPCAYPGVICVGAHGPDGALTHFTNHGSHVDIAAPGLNILAAWPTQIDSMRFSNSLDYEVLSGTSQSSPLVACLGGELLARGYQGNEIRPRLLLGARPPKAPLPLSAQMPHDKEPFMIEANDNRAQKRVLSGNASLRGAIEVTPQPLILPALRKVTQIDFPNQEVRTLNLDFQLKNFWLDASGPIKVRTFAGGEELTTLSASSLDRWPTNEQKFFRAQYDLKPNQRWPSEIRLTVQIEGAQSRLQQFEIRFEILRKLGLDEALPIGALKLDVEWPMDAAGEEIATGRFLVNNQFDPKNPFIDYLLAHPRTADNQFKIEILRQCRDTELNRPECHRATGPSSPYKLLGRTRLPWPDNISNAPLVVHRWSRFLNHRSVYVVTLSDGRIDQSPEFWIWVLDQNLRLLASFHHNGQVFDAPLRLVQNKDEPFFLMADESGQISQLAWLGFGPDPLARDTSRMSGRQLWNFDPQAPLPSEVRFYTLDQKSNLRTLNAPQIEGRQVVILSVLPQTFEELEQGRMRVLLREQPTTQVRSFNYFTIEMSHFKWNTESLQLVLLNDQEPLPFGLDPVFQSGELPYLGPTPPFHSGLFWFSSVRPKETLLILLQDDPLQRSRAIFKMFDLTALFKPFDGVFRARYNSIHPRLGPMTFGLTNTEIQFHHLTRGRIRHTSLRRYSFFSSMQTNDLNQPGRVFDHRLQSFLPAIFTVDIKPIHPMFPFMRRPMGLRWVVPHFNQRNELVDLLVPAELRFEAQPGCQLMTSKTIWDGQRSWADLDCFEQILRVPIQLLQ